MNLDILAPLYAEFNPEEYFLTREQGLTWAKTQPLRGLKILHNVPLYNNTFLKIGSLLHSGAEVWLSAPRNIPPSISALEWIKRLDLPFTPEPRKLKENFDIVLDCSGDYADLIIPRLGVVELTGTGSQYYRQHNLSYPVISVDDSKLKKLETFLGTGEGCWRALQQWLPEDLRNKKFMLFGFGKVGQGIAYYLKDKIDEVIIADINPQPVKAAQTKGFRAYLLTDTKLINALAESFAVITATGQEYAISRYFTDKNIFMNKYLINMGVHDEYGPMFAANEVLFQKQALNFSLAEPTRLKYLDPIFYAHNLGAELLATQNFAPGYYPFPKQLDDEIIKRWQRFHGETLN